LGLTSGAYVDDCNMATAFGLYSVSYATANNPLNAYGALLVLPHNETEKSQILISSYIKGIVIRHENGGVWGEWEWENPPMELGKLYRTTERWNGKVVYTKMVSVGNLPNASTKSVEGVVTNGFTNLVDLKYSIYAGYTHRNYDARVSMAVKTENQYAWIDITTTENLSDYAGFVTLKYTID
jgi:hypothetical protein